MYFDRAHNYWVAAVSLGYKGEARRSGVALTPVPRCHRHVLLFVLPGFVSQLVRECPAGRSARVRQWRDAVGWLQVSPGWNR
jgi:hypothetical protein